MKAPDKIYINADAATDLTYEPGEDDSKEVYVRKDTLLEWAKEMKDQCSQLRDDGYGDVFYNAQINAFETVINKIESL